MKKDTRKLAIHPVELYCTLQVNLMEQVIIGTLTAKHVLFLIQVKIIKKYLIH